jgi:hypothetical protein
MDFNSTKMDRRMFLGAVALSGGAAASGLPASASAKALFAAPAGMAQPAVFMDIPFADTTGLHKVYKPAGMNLVSLASHYEPHFHVA